jgi:hypothetical protein
VRAKEYLPENKKCRTDKFVDGGSACTVSFLLRFIGNQPFFFGRFGERFITFKHWQECILLLDLCKRDLEREREREREREKGTIE